MLLNCVRIVFGFWIAHSNIVFDALWWFGFKKLARTCASELRAHCVWPLVCSLEHCVRRAVLLWFGFKKFARTCSSEARAHCVLCFKMLTWTMKNCILPQRAQEILHHMNVRAICNIAACTLRFGFDGLTFRGWVDFSLTARAHAVGWLRATWVDLTPPPSSARNAMLKNCRLPTYTLKTSQYKLVVQEMQCSRIVGCQPTPLRLLNIKWQCKKCNIMQCSRIAGCQPTPLRLLNTKWQCKKCNIMQCSRIVGCHLHP